MSVDKWRYEEQCDSVPCCGDCDSCSIEWEEDDADSDTDSDDI